MVLGWHYAVDGYFSIIVMTLAWYLSGRWMQSRETRTAGARLADFNPSTRPALFFQLSDCVENVPLHRHF